MDQQQHLPHTNGRPPKGAKRRTTGVYTLRLTPAERAKLERASADYEQPTAALVRQALASFGLI